MSNHHRAPQNPTGTSNNEAQGPAEADRRTEDIRSKLVVKAVRNVRQGYEADDAGRGMYREGVTLDLQRSSLLTEAYKETEGQPMVIRRARGLANILMKIDLYIQDWEKIVGNITSSPQGVYYGIEQNYRSVERLVNSEEGDSLLCDEGRAELTDLQEETKDVFISCLRTWGDLGISQIQFNVVDRDTLLRAQQNPSDYPDLIVRVAGYSAYFVDLSKGLQDSIIERTEQSSLMGETSCEAATSDDVRSVK
jgi:pyruvate-formate lyase